MHIVITYIGFVRIIISHGQKKQTHQETEKWEQSDVLIRYKQSWGELLLCKH